MAVTADINGIQTKTLYGKVVLHKIPKTLSGDLVVPQRVTHIQITSFNSCGRLTSVTLQGNVKEIKAGAFKHCTNLEKIIVSQDNKYFESDTKGVLFTKGRDWLVCAPVKLNGLYIVPRGVKHIEKEAFKSCTDLTTLMLAQTVTSIGKGAFQDCTGLLHMIIPPCVTKIEPGAFAGCTQLCGVTVAADNVNFKTDQDGALYNKDKTRLYYVPSTLRGQRDKKDGRYIVPEGVTHIEDRAFWGCSGIKELILPDTLKFVGEDAFEGCSGLEKVYVPVGFSRWYVFDNCKNLQKRSVRDPLGLIYNWETKQIETVWKDIVHANILNGVEKIEPKTFAERMGLTAVAIPRSVTYISGAAFAGCKNLTDIQVDSENEVLYTDEHGVLFQKGKSSIALLRAPVNLGGSYCVPEGVTHIEPCAFECCTQLTVVTVPKSVWLIKPRAFLDCPNLTICGPAGSEAEKFAKDNKIPFAAK